MCPCAGRSRIPESSSNSPSIGTYCSPGGSTHSVIVVRFRAGILKFLALDVYRLAREEMVPSAVVEVEVGVDDDVDAVDIEVLLRQQVKAGVHVSDRRVQLRHARVHQYPRVGMVDDVHIDRHRLTLGEQLRHAKGGYRDCSGGSHFSTPIPTHGFDMSQNIRPGQKGRPSVDIRRIPPAKAPGGQAHPTERHRKR